MQKYKSRQEAIQDHKNNYRSKGWEKGKFKPNGPDSIRVRRIVSEIPDESVCLDIGCNDGGLGYLLRDKKAIVYGVDVVDELVELATQKGVLAKVCAAEELDFGSEFFDVVIMAETLEHCYDPHEALNQVSRVLTYDGIFLGSVPHPEGMLARHHHSGGDYHQSTFKDEELEQLLQKYFQKVSIRGTPYDINWSVDNHVDPEMYQWNNWICKKKK